MRSDYVTDAPLASELLDFIESQRDKKGNLIAILHKAQEVYGYVPWDLAEKLSEELQVPLAKIYGVLTFYHYFKLNKPGKSTISVCMGTACYLQGAPELIDELSRILGIGVGETSADGEFSIESVRCVGCCGLAPVVTVDEDTFGKLSAGQLAEILGRYRAAHAEAEERMVAAGAGSAGATAEVNHG
ncbi:MAG: NAD(P)H-dependent oxidoreductase subunit E [Spirochaetaceae bacterium]|nr:MAG: NAD(P)H-dependent oxidoreductase subunit E [Spirochaetaceae bacterium]